MQQDPWYFQQDTLLGCKLLYELWTVPAAMQQTWLIAAHNTICTAKSHQSRCLLKASSSGTLSSMEYSLIPQVHPQHQDLVMLLHKHELLSRDMQQDDKLASTFQTKNRVLCSSLHLVQTLFQYNAVGLQYQW